MIIPATCTGSRFSALTCSPQAVKLWRLGWERFSASTSCARFAWHRCVHLLPGGKALGRSLCYFVRINNHRFIRVGISFVFLLFIILGFLFLGGSWVFEGFGRRSLGLLWFFLCFVVRYSVYHRCVSVGAQVLRDCVWFERQFHRLSSEGETSWGTRWAAADWIKWVSARSSRLARFRKFTGFTCWVAFYWGCGCALISSLWARFLTFFRKLSTRQ